MAADDNTSDCGSDYGSDELGWVYGDYPDVTDTHLQELIQRHSDAMVEVDKAEERYRRYMKQVVQCEETPDYYDMKRLRKNIKNQEAAAERRRDEVLMHIRKIMAARKVQRAVRLFIHHHPDARLCSEWMKECAEKYGML